MTSTVWPKIRSFFVAILRIFTCGFICWKRKKLNEQTSSRKYPSADVEAPCSNGSESNVAIVNEDRSRPTDTVIDIIPDYSRHGSREPSVTETLGYSLHIEEPDNNDNILEEANTNDNYRPGSITDFLRSFRRNNKVDNLNIDENGNIIGQKKPSLEQPVFDFWGRCVRVPRHIYNDNRLDYLSRYKHIATKPLTHQKALDLSRNRGHGNTSRNTVFEAADFYIRWQTKNYGDTFYISGMPVKTIQCRFSYNDFDWFVEREGMSIAVFVNLHFDKKHLFRYDRIEVVD